ncbi:hypothetical protein CFP65_2811 [Kitasatospora sp. MMS16-BH015]|uniref:hypothetical protein n=1 Tax=Kitasatospora sp. MMS16-BH015 TaxID=2018025 RepID=UPI000CA399F4|nr:hypothetical protein [Kitasatospora sp. MMS16-BH015]AUG77628.1 hypothetical protein CFP65_2811 [Kitasatospora sp. MMS16-BH015]
MRPRTIRTALGLVLAAAALTGCGIRPTAVPVDAGAPASRTACPSPLHVPEAVVTRTPAPARPSPAPPVKPVHPSPSVTHAPDSPFTAGPTPSPSHCP